MQAELWVRWRRSLYSTGCDSCHYVHRRIVSRRENIKWTHQRHSRYISKTRIAHLDSTSNNKTLSWLILSKSSIGYRCGIKEKNWLERISKLIENMFLTDISGQVQHDNLSKAVLTTGISGATRGNYLVNFFYRGSTKQSEITMALRRRRHCNLPKIKK